MVKKPKLSDEFQQSILKGQGREWASQDMLSACAQFSDWLMLRSQGSAPGVNIINPQPPVGLGATCSWSSSISSHLLPFGGGFSHL